MKKILILTITCIMYFILTVIDINAYYIRRAVGGRDNGAGKNPTYNYVGIYRNGDTTSIYCQGPSAEKCPYKVAGPGRDPSPKTEAEQACVDYALEQIQLGNLSGNWTNPETQHYVEWNKTGVDINITVREPEEK